MPQGIQITLAIKDDGTAVIRKVSGEMKQLEQAATGGAGRIGAAWNTLKSSWVELAALGFSAKKAFDVAEEAARFEETVGRLNSQLAKYGQTAADVVPAIQGVVAGQLSMAQAAESASRGLAAGFDPGQIRTLLGLADGLSDQLGGTIQSAFEQLTQAISTGMFRSLKQVEAFAPVIDRVEASMKKLAEATGRTVDELTETEKRTIALNAVMGDSDAILQQLGGGVVTTADRFQAFKAQLEDVRLALGQGLLAAGIGAASLFQFMAGALADLYAAALNLTGFIPKLTDAIGLSNGEFERTRIVYEAAKLAAQDLYGQAYQTGILAGEQLRKVIDPLGEAQQRAGRTAAGAAAGQQHLTAAMQLQAKTIQGPLQAALKESIQHFEQLHRSAQAGLKALGQEQLTEQFAALPDVASRLQFIQSFASTLPTGGIERVEGLRAVKDLLKDVATESRNGAGALGEAQAKLQDFERQRRQLAGQSLGSAADLFPSVETLRALDQQKTALDANIEQQRALVQSMQAAGAPVSEVLGTWTSQLNDQLRLAWQAVEQDAAQSLTTARTLLDRNIESAAEFERLLGLLARTPEIRIKVTGLETALAQAAQLRSVLALLPAGAGVLAPGDALIGAGTVLAPSDLSGGFFDLSRAPFPGSVGFAAGGSFIVPGPGGTDSQPVRFNATPGERVIVQTPAQQHQSGALTVTVPITVNGSVLGTADQLAALVRERLMPELRRLNLARGSF